MDGGGTLHEVRVRRRLPRRAASGPEVGAERSDGPFRTLLGNRTLSLVVGAFAAVMIAEWSYVTALSIDAFRNNGAIAVGLVGLRLFFGALSSFLGLSVVPRVAPARLLVGVGATRAVVLAASAVLAASGAPLVLLLGLLAVDAVVAAQYRPAQAALIPTLARAPTELAAAAAGLSLVKTVSQAIGAVAGGLLLAVVSPALIFGAGAALLVAATGALSWRLGGLLAAPPPAPPAGRPGPLGNALAVLGDRGVAGLVLVSALRTFVRGMWTSCAVIASFRLLHAGTTGVGLLMLAAGVGSLIAAPLSSMVVTRPRLGTPTAVALVACGIPLAVIAGVPVFNLALGLVVAWGTGMAVADVATSSVLYRLVETPLVGGATSVIESLKLALEGLGAFIGPVLAATVGIRGALLVAAAPLPLVVTRGWRTLHRVDATAGERTALLELLHHLPFLRPLDMAALDQLIGRLTPMYVPAAGVAVVRQGDPGDRLYVIEQGTAVVLVDGFMVGVMQPGDSFGEKALLRDIPRTATVRSRGPMQLLVLPREDFLEVLTGRGDTAAQPPAIGPTSTTGSLNLRQGVDVLSRVPLLSNVDTRTLADLAERAVLDRWPAGSAIVRQGEEGDRFFVVLEGRARVSVDGRPVNELRPGDHFGEIALIHAVPRTADVDAATDVCTLSLHRDDFLPAVRARLLAG